LKEKKMKNARFAAWLLILGLVTALTSQAHAQFSIGPLRQLNSYFQGQPNTITATCAVMNCTATPMPIFVPTPLLVQCPKPAGYFCDLYIHLESQDTTLTRNDTGLFRFWVDNAAATPGPVDALGYFTWDNNDPDSRIAAAFSHSYAVVAHVYNLDNNQFHGVEVDVNCIDASGNGSCTASTGFSSLEVNIY
jgi:hypothetical protein